MKTIFASIIFMMLSIVGFSQTALIDGAVCANAPDCPKYVCENSMINLTAGFTGTPDSVKWRQRIWNGSTWSAYTIIGTSAIQSVPVGEAATVGHTYRYQLIVYSGGIPYFALADMYVNASPAVTLLSNYTTICAGVSVTFTASAGGTVYDFKKNGTSQQSGPSSTFVTSALANGDNITVTISNGTCTATSAPITMTVHAIPQGSMVGNTPLTGACPGTTTPVTISLSGTGPWDIEFWNRVGGVPTTLYFDAGTTVNPNVVVNVPVGVTGLNPLILKVSDAYCHN